MAYIEFKNVVKAYQMGGIFIQALDNTNFEIEKGELTVILEQVVQEKQQHSIS